MCVISQLLTTRGIFLFLQPLKWLIKIAEFLQIPKIFICLPCPNDIGGF